MTVKALRKQLMAAIAMVVVSAVALCSSTYAWFAANNKVTAEGMVVQAKAEGGIEIAFVDANNQTSSYGTTATANMATTSAAILLPTSTTGKASGGTIGKENWYYAKAESGNESKAKSDSRKKLSLNNGSTTDNQDMSQYYDSEGNQYFLVKTFNIRSSSTSPLAKGLKVNAVTVSGINASGEDLAKNMSQALRVAVVMDNKSLIYAPVGHSGVTDKDTDASNGTQYDVYTPGESESTQVITLTPNNALDGTLLAEDVDDPIPAKVSDTDRGGKNVNIYIYFEGEDATLYSQNYNSNTLLITVDFTADTSGSTSTSP